ncbi:MAG: ExbD/TolR family protein [Casimicrobiaceae bacterium]
MRPRKSINQINVVPYIDVMLVLLVIFMVTAPLITPGEIELPRIGSKPVVPAAPLHVVLQKDRSFLLRDERGGGKAEAVSNRARLLTLVKQKQSLRPDQPVVIEADVSVPYGEVVAILDLLQQSGAQKVGLLVQPAQK